MKLHTYESHNYHIQRILFQNVDVFKPYLRGPVEQVSKATTRSQHFGKSFARGSTIFTIARCMVERKSVIHFLVNKLAAASSRNQWSSPLVGLTLAAGSGSLALPSNTCCKTLALLDPVLTNATHLLALMMGYVSVILHGGGLGESEIGARRREFSWSSGWPGNKEHVCPSGPIPSRSISREGTSSPGYHPLTLDSYSLAASSSGISWLIVSICSGATESLSSKCCFTPRKLLSASVSATYRSSQKNIRHFEKSICRESNPGQTIFGRLPPEKPTAKNPWSLIASDDFWAIKEQTSRCRFPSDEKLRVAAMVLLSTNIADSSDPCNTAAVTVGEEFTDALREITRVICVILARKTWENRDWRNKLFLMKICIFLIYICSPFFGVHNSNPGRGLGPATSISAGSRKIASRAVPARSVGKVVWLLRCKCIEVWWFPCSLFQVFRYWRAAQMENGLGEKRTRQEQREEYGERRESPSPPPSPYSHPSLIFSLSLFITPSHYVNTWLKGF